MPIFAKKSDCEAQLAVSLKNFEKLQKEHEKLMDDYLELNNKNLGNSKLSDSDVEAELASLKLGGRKRKTRSRKSRRRKTLKQKK
jgi:hypothetical protein